MAYTIKLIPPSTTCGGMSGYTLGDRRARLDFHLFGNGHGYPTSLFLTVVISMGISHQRDSFACVLMYLILLILFGIFL